LKPILFITDTLAAGGIERQLSLLLLGIKSRGYQPHVLCLYGEKAGRSIHFARTLEEAQIPLHLLELSYSPFDKVRGIAAIIQSVWKLRPAIVHAFNYHSNLLGRAARPFMPPSTKLIGAVRNDYSPHQLRLEALSWRFCHRIIVNSLHLKDELLSVGIPQSHIALIANGLDTARFAKIPENVVERGKKTIVQMGRISRQKSPHLLAEALGLIELPEGLRVYIVGEVDSHPLHAVQDLLDAAIVKNQLEQIIIQAPQSDSPENYYHAADFTVLTSLYEGLPNVMLESLAAGKPVLISAAANMAGIIEEGKTGWIFPTNNIEALAQKLREIFALSEQDLAQMSSAAKAKAAEFSIERMIDSTLAVYNSHSR
jgi:glycosyltransferase involved in cell wall biosynthesis